MITITTILKTKKCYVIQYHKQAGNLTTNPKLKIDYTLTEFSVSNIVMLKYCVDDSAKGRYDMILGRYLLT